MITLCIPTMDRSHFLARALRYYATVGYQHWIAIGDSSGREHAERNQAFVQTLSRTLHVDYRHYPGLSACEVLGALSRLATTPYCAFLGDDDFLCVRGIESCVAFLERHPDYGAAHGQAVIFQTDHNRPYGSIGNMRAYPQVVLEASSGRARLTEFFTRSLYALLNSTHRTPIWRSMFQGLEAMRGVQNRNMFKDELLASCVSAIRGKVKAIEGLYLVRHVHVEDSYRFPHVYDWLTDPEWHPSFRIFQERVVEELQRHDGLGVEDARRLFRQVFWPYLAGVVASARRHEQAGGPRRPSRVREAAKQVPGLRWAWRAVRVTVQRSRQEISLPRLLNSASPYHEDFMPIYRLMTSAPSEGGDGGRQEGRPLEIALAGGETE